MNGLLVGPEDPDALADALSRLAKDPALRARLGREPDARTVAERFDGDALARELSTLFAGRAAMSAAPAEPGRPRTSSRSRCSA